MPTIPVFQDTSAPAQPGNVGTDAFISAARRVGPLEQEAGRQIGEGAAAIGNAVGGILQQREDDATHKEISQGMVQLAQMQAQHTDLWNKAANSLDPNDVNAAAGAFHDNVLAPAGEQFLSQFSTPKGRAWAQEAMARYQASAITRTANDAKTATADATVVGVNQTMNVLANTALKDPTTLDNSLSLWNSSVGHLSNTAGLSPDAAAKVSTALRQKGASQIVGAAMRGAIEADPATGLAALNSGKYDQYLTGGQSATLKTYADTVNRMRIAQGRADGVEQRRGEKEQFDQQVANISASVIQPDGSVRLPPDFYERAARLATLPGAQQSPGSIEAMVNFGHTVADDQAKGVLATSDPSTYIDLSSRMFGAPDDPTRLTDAQVYQARAAGKLSDKDFSFFHSAVDSAAKNPQLTQDSKQFDQFMQGYRKYIDRSGLTGVDAYGSQKYYEFYRDKQAQFITGRNAGVPVSEMLTPGSKAFIAGDIARYQPTNTQRMQELSSGVTGNLQPLPPVPAATPWKPGESMDDYAKRLQGGK